MSMNNIIVIKEFKMGDEMVYGIFDVCADADDIQLDLENADEVVMGLKTAIMRAQSYDSEYGSHFIPLKDGE